MVKTAVKQTEIKSINFNKSLNALSADHTLHLNILIYWHFIYLLL